VGDVCGLGIEALIELDRNKGIWIRPVEAWRPKTHNARRQLGELIRYLLVDYPVPAFMDAAWLGFGATRYQEWFLAIGRGQNIRKLGTPIPLTKKMAHHFPEAPEPFSIEQALRWGQVRGMGGCERLADEIASTRLGDSFQHEDFWVSIIRFLIENPMLDRVHVGPIIDFIQHQRFEERDVWVAQGVRRREPPPQPNLSMQGRTPESLLRQVDRWHRDLGKAARGGALEWESSKIGELEFKTGFEGRNLKIWRIRELLSSRDLVTEGRAMRHCVASYAGSCKAGRCSIWTMELESSEGVEKHQTIEVNSTGTIVQCRGPRNRMPTQQEISVLRRWAELRGLKIQQRIVDAGVGG
jgi:hypothetical protein